MTRLAHITVLSGLLLMAGHASALDRTSFDELTALVDSAVSMETSVFAPKTWQKAIKGYEKAKEVIDQNKSQKDLDKKVAESREYVENAIKATEVGKLSLQEYLDPRKRSKQAKAPTLVPDLFLNAETQFKKATAKVESGDVKGALKEAEKALPLFDTAELAAIQKDILGTADELIEKALTDDAGKFALSTLDKARTARRKANDILIDDRYERDESLVEADRAEYEARHASNIALSVRSLNRNDQAWEKLMLVYEIQMSRLGEIAGIDRLPFDEGPQTAADRLIASIQNLQSENTQLSQTNSAVANQISMTLASLGETIEDQDIEVLAGTVHERVVELVSEKSDLAMDVETGRKELEQLEQQHKETSAELAAKLEREDKFKKAKRTLSPSEGEVLFNSSNDIVLRLIGLSFDIGKSEIKEDHAALLRKVEEIIEMFPDAQLVVEGHTDASGNPSANEQLSDKRAYAVTQYLRQSLLIPSERIQSIGYGSDRPVASNQTSEGRAKNRRIDIIIMQ